jgi:hypothetical protein
VKPATSFVLVEWRLRHAAIGTFSSAEQAEAYKATLVQPKGWHVVAVEEPDPVGFLTDDLMDEYAGVEPHHFGQPCVCPECDPAGAA